MGCDAAQPFAAGQPEPGFDRPAGLSTRAAQVDAEHAHDRKAGEQHITVAAIVALDGRPGESTTARTQAGGTSRDAASGPMRSRMDCGLLAR